MRTAFPESRRVWLTSEGKKVGCYEKVKVMEQNLFEFQQLAKDLLEDAYLMNLSLKQVKEELLTIVKTLDEA